MPTDRDKTTRKLRAILSADVKGYSLLMADDEAFTIRTLKEYRSIMSNQIGQHDGRVVDSPGDNILADFASIVDAVTCAVEIQKVLKEKNQELPDDKNLEFRIGVNIGDVVQDGDRIYGNGVNVAARIEGLAEPGGVSISRSAYKHIRDKLSLGYKYLGEHNVKNIKHPVRVYKILMDPADSGKLIGEKLRRPRKKWFLPVAVVATIIVTSIIWYFSQEIFKPDFKPASTEKMAFTLPEKPSIAVLPFDNFSDDPGQEYFSDGLTEEIITGLSKIPSLFVIARNSSFTYKGKPVKIQQVSEELGVRYVLEGSVRKEGDRVRITTQLIDAVSGYHRWSKRYDRQLKDIFALQDEIMKDLLTEMRIQLIEGEQSQLLQAYRDININFEAYEKMMQSRWHFFQMNPEGFAMSKKLAEEALEIDPYYYAPYIMLAVLNRNSPLAEEYVKKALELNDSSSSVLTAMGLVYLDKRQYDKAIALGERALALDPNGAEVKVHLGYFLYMSGRFDEAIALYEQALRLNPYPPSLYYWRLGSAYAYGNVERNDEAVEILSLALKRNPEDIYARLILASVYIRMGREEEARAEAKRVLKVAPTTNLKFVRLRTPQKNTRILNAWIEDLRRAGIPETTQPSLPDKPSIAILPFVNMSNDPEQEYFSDGMTDTIITDLSKLAGLKVISRNSAFTYKGKDVKIPEVAKELGVRYILEGSVQKAENQIRIIAQLIDSQTDSHIWADRFDDTMDNIFELQDSITIKIVTALAVKLAPDEEKRIKDKGTENISAYDFYLKGAEYIEKFTPQDYLKAIEYYKQALQIDPDFNHVYERLAEVYWFSNMHGFFNEMNLNPFTARLYARKYLESSFDGQYPSFRGYRVAASMAILRREYKKSIELARTCVELAPNEWGANSTLGRLLVYSDKPKEAIIFINKSIEIDPRNRMGTKFCELGFAYFGLGQLEKTIEYINKGQKINPRLVNYSGILAASYAHLGKQDEAKAEIENYLKSVATFHVPSFAWLLYMTPYKNYDDFDRFASGLSKAGYPGYPKAYNKIIEENKLTEEEIQKIYSPPIKFRTGADGYDILWSYYDNGEAFYDKPHPYFGSPSKGKWWIDGDMVCSQWETIFDDLISCGSIYRIHESDSQSEYIGVSDLAHVPFSIE